MASLKEKYIKTIAPALKKELGIANINAVPRVEKIVLNAGLSLGIKDKSVIDAIAETLKRISGQKPVATKARKSISNFKIRQGMDVGMVVTLRGQRMYDFLEKLVTVTFARVRDFRGVEKKHVDLQGNLNYGFREHVAFPEIRSDEIEKLHGLQITIVTNAKTRDRGLALLSALGIPFNK